MKNIAEIKNCSNCGYHGGDSQYTPCYKCKGYSEWRLLLYVWHGLIMELAKKQGIKISDNPQDYGDDWENGCSPQQALDNEISFSQGSQEIK